MSVQLTPVSLAGAVAGTTNQVDFSKFARRATQMQGNSADNGSIVVYSESGCGLTITLDQSQWSTFVPAGGWKVIALGLGDLSFTYQVVYTLPNPPVSLLVVIYYQPGQAVDDPGILGNSPIGLSGSVPTSVTQVIQDGQTIGLILCESTPSGSGQTVLIKTDGTLAIAGTASFVGGLAFIDSSGNFGFGANVGGSHSSLAYSSVNHEAEFSSPVATATHQGLLFVTWNGAARIFPFGIGASGVVGLTQLSESGAFSQIASQATAGNYGVPVVVAAATRFFINVTTTVTILTYSVPATGVYRIHCSINIQNSSAGSPTLRVDYVDTIGANFYNPSGETNGSGFQPMNGTHSFPANWGSVNMFASMITAVAGTLTVKYTTTGTPSDQISAYVERLA